MSYDPTQQKKWGLASLVSLLATALLFFSFFLPWFGWSWSCNGSDCQGVTLSLKTNPPVSSGFSVASNGVSLVSASASVPSGGASAPVGDRAVIAVSIDNFRFLYELVLLVAIISHPLASILMNLFKTSERGLQTQQPTQESAQPPIVPDSSPSPTKPWKKRGLAFLISLIAFFFWVFVANNGASMVATSAPVGDREVIAVSTDSFSFPFLWLVLVISIVLFLLQILMNLFKTGARWELHFILIITTVALYVELLYMANAFGAISSTSANINVFGNGSLSLYAALATSNPLVDVTLHLSHGPSFGFWLGLFATLVVGGVGVVRVVEAYRASSGGRHLRHD